MLYLTISSNLCFYTKPAVAGNLETETFHLNDACCFANKTHLKYPLVTAEPLCAVKTII